jgi:hypothetical protein
MSYSFFIYYVLATNQERIIKNRILHTHVFSMKNVNKSANFAISRIINCRTRYVETRTNTR